MVSKSFWSSMKKVQQIHRFLYAVGLGPLVGKIILLLTTTGRKSGQLRVTPLQYEEIEGKIFLGSARGTHADWFRNLLADNRVQVRLKNRRFTGMAEVVTEPTRIVDFLEIRLQRHPHMVGWMMAKIHHVSSRPTRQQLEQIAASEALVIITPTEG
jgi:deazaflavin-dependent oxidoreductase (nitroreductase family)